MSVFYFLQNSPRISASFKKLCFELKTTSQLLKASTFLIKIEYIHKCELLHTQK